MQCPSCNTNDTKVIDSRLLLEGQTVRRRRKCESCDFRFTTYEKIQIQMPAVVKHDGRRENFNREKILKGLKKACQKRAVSTDELDKLIDNVEKIILENHPKEVPAEKIGDYTMTALHQLDPVSYVRFASFYWDFNDIDSFVSSLQNNLNPKKNVKQKGLLRDQPQ